jgi:hypothetical protein
MMRGLRSTLLLIVVLGGLGAYIYFVMWRQAPDEGVKAEKVFAALQPDKVEELRIRSSGGETTILRKTGGGWAIEEPVKAAADDTTVSGIATSLGSLEIVRVVDENPADLKAYGLATPRVDVGFKNAGDKEYQQLEIGDDAPTGGNTFAKLVNSKRVFLIGAYQRGEFDRSTFDLRDKRVVKFDRDKVDGAEARNGQAVFRFAKRGDDWRITSPIEAVADVSSVEGLVGALQNAQMKSIVTADATPADLKKYRLDKADQSLTVEMGSARATLLLGAPASETAGTVYARDASASMVVTVDSTLATDASKGVDDYRRKDIFAFRPYNVEHLEIVRNGQTIVLDRVKAAKQGDADTWQRASPTQKALDADAVNSVLSKLTALRATSFVESTADTGLDKPEITISARFEGKDERAAFAKPADAVYVSRSNDAGAAKLDPGDYAAALKAIDDVAK